MRVAVLGGGGRESAIAWACRMNGHEVEIHPELPADLDDIDLVIPGPEALLAAGVADECARRTVPCFGPTAALAQLEASKGYARRLATTLGIPSPMFARFEPGDVDGAISWWEQLGDAVVVKQDGLAAGRGVVVPDDEQATREAIEAAAALGPFVVETRMIGQELTLTALCSGREYAVLPLAQDHKRVGEGDTGPNTGGMGAYAPAAVREQPMELAAAFVKPVLDHFADAGTPFVGVIYAGLMVTAEGPKLVEYNVRFGDPETQALLPLLTDDIAQLALDATKGALATQQLGTVAGAACTVVAAAAGYPDAPRTGDAVTLPHTFPADAVFFPAGMADGATTGGRVLAVTGLGEDLDAARAAAYALLDDVHFDGMQVRRDIGWRAAGASIHSYAEAGVDIEAGTRAVARMRDAVESTHGPSVLRGVGSFGGAFSLGALADYDEPILVASTDGVGTKVELAARLGRVGGVGRDIVNHCIGDVLVQSARPLFFLDYIAASRLDPELVADVVNGMAEACAASDVALLGGETAEMPGVYAPGAFDVAGTLIGVAERSHLLPRDDVAIGDVLVGVASSGPHTNGYSLLRKVFAWAQMDAVPPGLDRPLGDALLEPHRSYLPVLQGALDTGLVKALAHITGGGLPENVPRALPVGIGARIELGSWPLPPLFELIRELTPSLDTDELYRTLNMGIGMVIVCAADEVASVQAAIGEPTWVIGEIVAADEHTRLTLVD